MSNDATLEAATDKGPTRSPYAAFEDEILQLIIKPKIDAILDSLGDAVTSRAIIYSQFRERYGATVSQQMFSKWLNILGYNVSRPVVITRPE